jgi:L-asparaginase/Glu-tRNA(Gln) amidotransferase subunit D
MAEQAQNPKQAQQNFEDPVAVTYTDDHHQAEELEELLKSSEIPAMVRECYSNGPGTKFAVMVPEDYLDEAGAIVDSQETYQDFYELINEDDELNFLDD